MKIFKIALLNIAGWILPNGEVKEVEVTHERYVFDNPELFNLDKDKFKKYRSYYEVEDKLLYWLAMEKGSVRFFIGAGNFLAIEGTRKEGKGYSNT